MNAWELPPMANLLIGIFVFLCVQVLLWLRDSRRDSELENLYQRREVEHLELIKNLVNRVHAKDLSSYAMLEKEAKAPPPLPPHPILDQAYTGNDEIDAMIEERKRQLIHRELNGGAEPLVFDREE